MATTPPARNRRPATVGLRKPGAGLLMILDESFSLTSAQLDTFRDVMRARPPGQTVRAGQMLVISDGPPSQP